MTSFYADRPVEQAADIADAFMHDAVKNIDDMFGAGYAKQHPELLGACMGTAALNLLASKIDGLRDIARREASDAGHLHLDNTEDTEDTP
jgi:hypothetical protein